MAKVFPQGEFAAIASRLDSHASRLRLPILFASFVFTSEWACRSYRPILRKTLVRRSKRSSRMATGVEQVQQTSAAVDRRMEELVERFEALSIGRRRRAPQPPQPAADQQHPTVSKAPYRGGLLGLPTEVLNTILLLVSTMCPNDHRGQDAYQKTRSGIQLTRRHCCERAIVCTSSSCRCCTTVSPGALATRLFIMSLALPQERTQDFGIYESLHWDRWLPPAMSPV